MWAWANRNSQSVAYWLSKYQFKMRRNDFSQCHQVHVTDVYAPLLWSGRLGECERSQKLSFVGRLWLVHVFGWDHGTFLCLPTCPSFSATMQARPWFRWHIYCTATCLNATSWHEFFLILMLCLCVFSLAFSLNNILQVAGLIEILCKTLLS